MVWQVQSVRSDIELGQIRWHGAWRQYCFFPSAETIFNNDCLLTIVDRVETCNRWQRNFRKNLNQ